ncbi:MULTISPECIES: hypothetical protein [Actibacterium]|uniref:Uncharacterized protein n=1 Tax=Actibacterium naphthalenivorans TaxID=1614693 RepID=A0A840CBC8_9RHOB|nr:MULTISPECIES: hypothetical protein [Actibacterium]ALG90995.1 hypothetical protein TQ29_13390 [Actibacterium sp. EMB200-NS6]MBB4023374.1 hypothetical protein [Actibacterium naphthalenivorans]
MGRGIGGIGHNKGPTMEPGTGWRTHCWKKARADLLPTLPLEIVRLRVRRAQEIGLDYRTYATVRATTGRDIVAFLFSSNALLMHRSVSGLPRARADKLRAIRACDRSLAAHRPLDPATVLQQLEAAHDLRFDHAFAAPAFTESWAQLRDRLQAALSGRKIPRDAVLMIGDTAWEREWSVAGRMAGYLPADRYFG